MDGEDESMNERYPCQYEIFSFRLELFQQRALISQRIQEVQ